MPQNETPTAGQGNGSALAVASERELAVMASAEAMLADVPSADEDAVFGIAQAILNATDVMGVDAPWFSAEYDKLLGVPIRITAIRKFPSDYEGGLGWFLVADITVIDTGEKLTVTVGGTLAILQLVKVWALNGLPWDCIPRVASRSKPGRNPSQHFESVR
jgi:hypothetical protein